MIFKIPNLYWIYNSNKLFVCDSNILVLFYFILLFKYKFNGTKINIMDDIQTLRMTYWPYLPLNLLQPATFCKAFCWKKPPCKMYRVRAPSSRKLRREWLDANSHMLSGFPVETARSPYILLVGGFNQTTRQLVTCLLYCMVWTIVWVARGVCSLKKFSTVI